MRCPFRVAAFDRDESCDPECAWLVVDARTSNTSCAIALEALKGASDFHVVNFEKLRVSK